MSRVALTTPDAQPAGSRAATVAATATGADRKGPTREEPPRMSPAEAMVDRVARGLGQRGSPTEEPPVMLPHEYERRRELGWVLPPPEGYQVNKVERNPGQVEESGPA